MYKPVPVLVHAQEGKKPDRTGPLNPRDKEIDKVYDWWPKISIASLAVCVVCGRDRNTGCCDAGLVEHMREIGLDGSLKGVGLGEVLVVELEKVEW